MEKKGIGKKYYKPQRRDNRNFRTKKRYFLRRSDNRSPFLHKRNKRYSSKYEEQERVLIIDSVNENILVCDDEIKDDETIYSIIETDEVENEALEYEASEDEIDLIDELAGLKIEMMNQVDCEHDWIRGKGDYNIKSLLDTGCTKKIIHDKYFMRCPEIVETIDDNKVEVSTDMLGIRKIHNQLAYNIEACINGTKYIIDEITIRDLSVINDDMIIGLRFLQQYLRTTIIHEEGVTFIPYQDNVPYIFEVRKQRKSLQNVDISNLDDEYGTSPHPLEFCKDEELSETIEEYHIENTCTECIGLQSFSPNWYRNIKSKKDIDKIVQRLESIQIIGEIPIKHWDKNSIVCKINIINPDNIIKSGPIEATPKDI
uniref:Uncharacterized protein n=1 Tax=Aegilops tauschii subsp. strangulata TaxID=200361 RepID=A0A453HM08_AEGTS